MTSLADSLRLAEIPPRASLRYSGRFTEPWMEAQRQVGDPLADAVVGELKERFPIRDPGDMLVEVRRLAIAEGGVYADFVEHCHSVPEWVDFAAMEPGLRMYATMGPLIAASILGGGVLGSAFHVNAEPVFTSTGRFVVERGVAERLRETGSILFLLPLPGEVRPGGRHHAVVMKVRLLHAAIRHWILTRDPSYDVARLGVPINQEDMAYAILIFTYLNVRGLLRLGVPVSDEQIRSLQHVWRWVGHVIGVAPEWQTASVEEEVALHRAFLLHQARPGVASPAARNLLEGAVLGLPGPLRGFARRTLHHLTAFLGGDEYVSGLRLDTNGPSVGLLAMRGVARAYGLLLRLPGGEAALYRWGTFRIRRQYADFGTEHEPGYGVTTLSREEIDDAMARARAEVGAASG